MTEGGEKGQPTTSAEPVDRLTRLCAAMTEALETHPEYGDDVKAQVFLQGEGRGGIVLHGYTDQAEAAADLFVHLKAMFQSQGADLEFIAVPNDPGGL